MQHLVNQWQGACWVRDLQLRRYTFRALAGECPETHDMCRLQGHHDRAKCLIASRFKHVRGLGTTTSPGKLVGGLVGTTGRYKGQRTPVPNEGLVKELIGGTKSLLRPRPHPSAADLTARASKTIDWALWVHALRRGDLGDAISDAKKSSDCSYLTKRHAGLRHAKWTRIHSYKEDVRLGVRPREEGRMCAPRILQWVVGVCNRRTEIQQSTAVSQSAGDSFKRGMKLLVDPSGHAHISKRRPA